MRLNSRGDVAAKVQHEGGIWAALEYGLGSDDMPAGDDGLRSAWRALEAAFAGAQTRADDVEALLDL